MSCLGTCCVRWSSGEGWECACAAPVLWQGVTEKCPAPSATPSLHSVFIKQRQGKRVSHCSSGDRSSGMNGLGGCDARSWAHPRATEALGCWWDSRPLVCPKWEISWACGCCVLTSHISWTVNTLEICRVFFFWDIILEWWLMLKQFLFLPFPPNSFS